MTAPTAEPKPGWENNLRWAVESAIERALDDLDRQAHRDNLTHRQVYEYLQRNWSFEWADAWAEYAAEEPSEADDDPDLVEVDPT